MMLRQVTAPTDMPVSLDFALEANVIAEEDRALFATYVLAASDYLDAKNGILGRALSTQTWRASWSQAPVETFVSLPFPPLQSVSSVGYIDADGAEQAFTDFRVITEGDVGGIELVDGSEWPSVADRKVAFWVEYVCGYTAVPQSIQALIAALSGHYFDNREAVGKDVSLMPYSVEYLITQNRVDGFH